MTIIGWLILAEVITAIAIVAWLLHRTHKRLKHSPAEQALKQHLAELEQAKSEAKTDQNTLKASESNDIKGTRTINSKQDASNDNEVAEGASE